MRVQPAAHGGAAGPTGTEYLRRRITADLRALIMWLISRTGITALTRLVLNIYGGALDGSVQVKLPGRRGWITVPRRAEVAPEVEETYRFNKTLEKRSRNPLFIPMLRRKSPHVWALDLSDDPAALAALCTAAPGLRLDASDAVRSESGTPARPIRIRYRDPSMRFNCRTIIRHLPNP